MNEHATLPARNGHDHGRAASHHHGGAVYTCPMHPEIREKHPGRCPLCGMRLEDLGRGKQSRT